MSCSTFDLLTRFQRWVLLVAVLILQVGLVLASENKNNSGKEELVKRYGQHDPGRKVLFVITLHEDGSAGEAGWSMKGEARYALLPTWDGASGVDLSLLKFGGQGQKKDLQSGASAENLFESRGGFLGLKEGEVLQFYRKESSDEGKGWVDIERHSWTGSKRDSVSTVTLDGRYTSTNREDLADIADAELVRTKTGATLEFRWWLDPGWEELGGSASIFGFTNPESARVLTFNLTNEDLRNWDNLLKTNNGIIHYDEDEGVKGTMKAILSAAPIPKDETQVTVTVEPASDYEKWIPEGNLNQPGEAGNRIKVKLQVHKKGDPKTLRKANLAVSLTNVSKEKGVCMNWPSKDAEADFGLRFPEKENKGFVPSEGADAGQSLKTEEPVENAEIMITSHDFGAYGILHITGTDTNGENVRVVVLGKDTPDLSIPMDENHNHIADAWEKKWAGGLQGQETGDDDDIPSGKPGCGGDGLTLYEEYRGFKISGGPEQTGDAKLPQQLITGQHVRTDPRVKDVFICDKTSGKIGGPGIVHFGLSTGLRVHRLAVNEIDENRVVNVYAGQWHDVDQHGILLMDGAAGSDPQQVPEKDLFGPPVLTKYVSLPPGKAYSSGDSMADLAHEIAHAVGVQHHGEENLFVVEWYWQLESDGAWRLYEQSLVQDEKDGNKLNPYGKAIPIKVYYEPKNDGDPPGIFKKGDAPPEGAKTVGVERWRLWLAGQGSQLSGDQECLMRYSDKQAYVSNADPENVRYLPDKSQWKMRDRLCAGKEGTGVNKMDHYPQPRYGDALVGNCQGQLVVNDKYAK